MPTPTMCLETARGENVRSTELTLEKESCIVLGGRKMGALIWSSSESNCYETHGCARIGMFVLRMCVRKSIFVYVCVCISLSLSLSHPLSLLHSLSLSVCVCVCVCVYTSHARSLSYAPSHLITFVSCELFAGLCQCLCLYLYMGEGFHDSVLHSGLRACSNSN